MVIELGRKSLLGKAKDRPDQVRKVLVKLKQEGLRATFTKAMAKLETPVPLGYSCAGTVVAVGDGVSGWAIGDRVACAGQGYASHAEYVSVPKNLCVRIPDGVASADAAFVTLGAIAMQGVRVAEVSLGECVCVIGLGLLGQLSVQILRAAGCKVVGIDLDPAKVELAAKSGAGLALSRSDDSLVSKVMSWTHGRGVDKVLITAATKSNDPVALAGELCRDKGIVVVVGAVGMDVPRRPFYDKELELRLSRSYGPGRYDRQYEEKGIDYPFGYVRWTEQRNMESFLELVQAGSVKIGDLVTHRFPITQAKEAYALITAKGGGNTLGVLLQYPEQTDLKRRVEIQPLKAGRAGNLRVAIVGAGDFARSVLIPALSAIPNASVQAVVTATGISCTQVARKVGARYATTDVEEVLRDGEVDAVMIATRHNLHAETVLAALEAGKAVFVEKPLALNSDELRRIAEAARHDGRSLMVGFNRRFAPIAREVWKHMSGKGPLIMNYRINAGAISGNHWTQDPAEGGGRVLGEVCHFIDLMQYLVGREPTEVFAVPATVPGGPGNDNLAVTVRFGDGSVGQIVYSSTGSPILPKERLEVFGGGCSAVIDDFRTGAVYGSRQVKLGNGQQDKGHKEEVAAWVTALTQGKPSPIALDEILATTAATFAVEASVRSGQVHPVMMF